MKRLESETHPSLLPNAQGGLRQVVLPCACYYKVTSTQSGSGIQEGKPTFGSPTHLSTEAMTTATHFSVVCLWTQGSCTARPFYLNFLKKEETLPGFQIL